MILYYKCNMPDMQVRTLAFIGDAGGGISDEKNKIFFVPYLTLAECHHAAASTVIEILRAVKAKYVYGATATPMRSDGLEKIGYMLLGNIRYRIWFIHVLQGWHIHAVRQCISMMPIC